MLTKNQTKYSYARKLFALPILFFMVLAYMVNAKNKEITETNKAIEIAVNELKQDTIKPKASEFDSLATEQQRQTRIYSEALQEDHLKMSAISKKMADKGKELSALKKAKKDETPEYKALESDMDQLSSEMEKIVSSENYQKNLKGLKESSEAIAKLYDSPEFKKKIADAEKKATEADKMVNSPAFKKKIADAEKRAAAADKLVNSPAFKKRIADAEKRAAEADKMVNSPEFKKRIADAEKSANEAVAKVYDSPEFKKRLEFAEKLAKETSENFGKIYSEADFQKMIKDSFGKDAFTDGPVAFGTDGDSFPKLEKFSQNLSFNFNDDVFNSDKSKLSPKELKKLEKKRKELQKKQQELLEEQKKIQKKQKDLNKEMRQNPLKISFNSNFDNSKLIILDNNKLASNFDKTTIYINGKKVERSEMQKIDPKDISSMNVIRNDENGSIRIITK